MKVWRQGEGPVFNYTKMTVNTLSRGWLDYAQMARLFGQFNNSLWGPTGCTQGEPAKSKTKGGLFKRAVLTGEPAVKPLLRQDKRNCQSTSDGNYLFYIYIFIWHKISFSMPILWGVQSILLNCGTERSSRGHWYRADFGSKPTSHKNWCQNFIYLDKQQSLGKVEGF